MSKPPPLEADAEIAFKATFPDGSKRHVVVGEARVILERLLLQRFAGRMSRVRAFVEAVTGKTEFATLVRRDCVDLAYYAYQAPDEMLQRLVRQGHAGDTFVEIRIKARFKGEATPRQRRQLLQNAQRIFREADLAPPGLRYAGVVVSEGDALEPATKTHAHGDRAWSIRWSGPPRS
jgi:hypothetical protein